MHSLISKIGDARLNNLLGSLPIGDSDKFQEILKEFPEYDPSFLWLLCYERADMPASRKYVEQSYLMFHKVLDRGFPRLLATKEKFDSRMWEMILCDIFSSHGEILPRRAGRADILLKTRSGSTLQVESVAPNESQDASLRAFRPDYNREKQVSFGGAIHDMERPIVLRTLQAINDKKSGYLADTPLLIAINSSKVVGTISDDNYVLRRILFGLGNWTTTQNGPWTFEQLPDYIKPGANPFPIAYFRRPEFGHISGVVYSSQKPLGFIPGGYSWFNSGITFVPNPLATHPVNIDFPYFKKMICNSTEYREVNAAAKFQSNVV